MRLGIAAATGAALVLLAAAAACGSDDNANNGGDDGGASEIEVERFDAGVPLDQPLVLGRTLLAAGRRPSLGAEEPGLYRSDDLGETWVPAEPADVPGWIELELDAPTLLQPGLASVSGRQMVDDPGGGLGASGDAYVWTTADGTTWLGGRLTGPGPDSAVTVHAVDSLLFAATATGPADQPILEVYRSVDSGASWTLTDVAGVVLSPEQQTEVTEVWRLPDGRLAAGLRSWPPGGINEAPEPPVPTALVSADDGLSWTAAPCPVDVPATGSTDCQPPEIEPNVSLDVMEPPVDAVDLEENPPSLDGVAELPGGGWLAAASAYETGDMTHGFLLRSNDGRAWDHVLPPEHCAGREEISRPNSSVSTPLRVGDGWLVAYTCGDLVTALESKLYRLDADGTGPVEVPDTALPFDYAYQEPLIVDEPGVVIVIGRHGEEGSSMVTRLRVPQ